MSERFTGLKKIAKEPALRLLALANMRLDTKLKSPASAPVDQVLAELDAAGAYVDMLRLLAVALPPRERVWWACLAAEDTLVDRKAPLPTPLAAAQAWVFKPSDEAREKARQSVELAEFDDTTTLCATAVAMCDGKLGTGELSGYDAPTGTAAAAVFGMNLMSLGTAEADAFEAHRTRLIDRALDIARGGNGRLGEEKPATAAEGDAP